MDQESESKSLTSKSCSSAENVSSGHEVDGTISTSKKDTASRIRTTGSTSTEDDKWIQEETGIVDQFSEVSTSEHSLPEKLGKLHLKMPTDYDAKSSCTGDIKCPLSSSAEDQVSSSMSSSSSQTNFPCKSVSNINCFSDQINKIIAETSSSSPTSSPTPSPKGVGHSPLSPLSFYFHKRPYPKTQSLDIFDDQNRCHQDDDEDESKTDDQQHRQRQSEDCVRSYYPQNSAISRAQKNLQTNTSPPSAPLENSPRVMIPKLQSLESRPIYPNVPYSPYGSPYNSPRSNRRRTPLRESRRISIEQSGSFLQLNQYKLMDQIGQGSYGLVKLAYNEEDSTHYAMKILSKRRLLRKAGLIGRGPKKTTSPLDRVYREIAVLKKLDHPNVVKLIEVLDDPLEDSLYLVFELVQQGEVLSVPTDQPLSEERAWCIFRDAHQGLEYLHYQRIIHGDIKPGNLLLAECGRVKIADLGVCNEFLGEDAAMNNGSTAGTPAFRAPETLIPGQHLYSGKAADIWALGATLYALVYGNVPFVANSVPALYEKIKNDQLKFPDNPEISLELRNLIEKILTKDPSRRVTLPQIKENKWVTVNGTFPLPSEDENCRLVQISDEDIHTVVKSIPKLDTLILIKTMLKNHSFQNPFSKGVISGRAPQRGGSRLERFTRAGRSNSAPGAYMSERQMSSDNILPSVLETVPSSYNDSSDQSCEG